MDSEWALWLVVGILALAWGCLFWVMLGLRRDLQVARVYLREMEAKLLVSPQPDAPTALALSGLRTRAQALEASNVSLLQEQGRQARRVTQALTDLDTVTRLTEANQKTLTELYETLGRAVGGFKGLAVHSGPEHTPDLYVASRQNVAGVPKETWRCHHCAYREVRDSRALERTDIAQPEVAPVVDLDTVRPVSSASQNDYDGPYYVTEKGAGSSPHSAPDAPPKPKPSRRVVATDQTLTDAWRHR